MPEKPVKKKKQLPFHYIKKPSYRSHYVDGVIGGLTPKGMVFMDLFLERRTIPQKHIYEIDEKGAIVSPAKTEGKQGVVREIETGLIMDYNSAIALKRWLDDRIKEFETTYISPDQIQKH